MGGTKQISLDDRKAKHWLLLVVVIILTLSIATHFVFFGQPAEVVFDEVHFGKFISGYLNHRYFFDIHPPLGKLAISGVAKITGYQATFDFKEIGEKYPDHSYLSLRFLPVVFGTFLPLIIFFLSRILKFSLLASFVSALLVIFENALLCQSLFILLDSMLLFFGFLGLLLYLVSRRMWDRSRSKIFTLLVSILAFLSLTFSLAVKWTGAAFLGFVIGMEIFDFIRRKSNLKPSPSLIARISIMLFLPLIVYFAIFAFHFAVLNQWDKGAVFHSPKFQKTLAGNPYQNNPHLRPANLVEKFIELNVRMFTSNRRIQDNHPYTSKWYSWPLMFRPIYYWNGSSLSQEKEKIYLFGNPIIFWGSFIGLIFLIFSLIFRRRFLNQKFQVAFFILFGFLFNYLPFIFLSRPMFLYHYLAALVFAILALCFVIDQIKNEKFKKIAFSILVILAVASFLWFSPLTYGLALSPQQLNLRFWFENWR